VTLREEKSSLEWAATRPEDSTPATAVAVGHRVQVGLAPLILRVVKLTGNTQSPEVAAGGAWRFAGS
jgi:hypothetical protein